VSRARFLAEAEAEFLYEVAYYAERQPNGAIRFRQAVEAATARALAFPQAGPSYLVRTRRVFVRGYPAVVAHYPEQRVSRASVVLANRYLVQVMVRNASGPDDALHVMEQLDWTSLAPKQTKPPAEPRN